ncbi:hypothetical protein ILUMI_01541 [Ignelater luminosus]|uniref:Alanyl-transfer RNA synthetases family profile domain-containing protein n=1 Tax=Ignelater luminosus TaxID=2038154 RepID=A0A8K0GHC1_IGNLU|nr:hypothetical protein ILUMI_01541 [Ignelater luminosus]
MVFMCQSDSFLKEYSSSVISCTESQFNALCEGKEATVNGYEVVLEDTILFPEGGGQPCDHGFLNESKVYQVKRQGDSAIHYVDKPLAVGEKVKQTIDWDRRFDHMQQHSGQHLITAIIDREFSFGTISWWLGEQASYIELDTPSFTSEQINKIENIANELIRENKKVSVQVFKTAEELNNVRARGLPKDHVGDVRVITIDGIESNMCCGTHVTSLSQLQVIKLLNVEKSKRKNKILLYFIVGNRVLRRLASCVQREERLTTLLKNNPSEHTQLVEKLQKNVKTLTKDFQHILKTVAVFEAEKYKSITPPPKYYVLHYKGDSSDFMNTFIREIGGPTETFFFLSVGEDKGAGSIMLYGNENAITDLKNKIVELLDGKGAGQGNKFTAKVNNLNNRAKVETLLKQYFQ